MATLAWPPALPDRDLRHRCGHWPRLCDGATRIWG
jgi:hypothetical protein